MKREQERQRNEATLSIPDDHPVRKLFQRFRQQRDSQILGESAAYIDHNCVEVEPQHHHPHADSNAYPQCQSLSSQQQDHLLGVQNKAPCTGGGSVTTPQAFVYLQEVDKCCTKEVGESVSRSCVEGQRVSLPTPSSVGGGDRAVGGSTSSRGARGWAKFRNAASAAPPPPVTKHEHQQKKAEEWPRGSQSSEQLAVSNKKQDSEEVGSVEGGISAAEASEETSALHKTDSCDSGITVRIDRAGDSRNSFEKSPMEKSPLEKNPFEPCAGADKHSFVQPVSEQTLLQAMLHEAKLELKGDIQILSGRLSVLESRVGEILRLLSIKRRLSLPPTSSPKAKTKSQDSIASSKPATPETDEGPF